MSKSERIFWAVVLIVTATIINLTYHTPLTWPVSFAGGWFIGSVLGERRPRHRHG